MPETEGDDPPPVNGLSQDEEKVWGLLYKKFKQSNNYLNGAAWRISRYIAKNKMGKLLNEISLYVGEWHS